LAVFCKKKLLSSFKKKLIANMHRRAGACIYAWGTIGPSLSTIFPAGGLKPIRHMSKVKVGRAARCVKALIQSVVKAEKA
jgi:hypothetical protein